MAIKAVIWDLGGVLVRTEDGGPRETLAAELGMSREQLEKEMFDNESGRKGQIGEISGEAHWQGLADRFGLERDSLVARFFEGDRLDRELVEYIQGLKRDHQIALLSNAFSTLRQYLEDSWGILDLFDEVVISAEVGLIKPDNAIYELILGKLGVQAEESIFVDDFAHNIEAANHLGMHGIQFQSRDQAIAEVRNKLASS